MPFDENQPECYENKPADRHYPFGVAAFGHIKYPLGCHALMFFGLSIPFPPLRQEAQQFRDGLRPATQIPI